MSKAFWIVIALLVVENVALLALFATGRLVSTADLNEGERLLLVSVDSQERPKLEEFELDFEKSVASEQRWVEDPIAVARRAVGAGASTTLWLSEGKGENPDELKVTAITDGFSDDSIRGERSELAMKRDKTGRWHILRAEKSRRCWPGRGHQTYATEPCS